jgi:hypothetical protein
VGPQARVHHCSLYKVNVVVFSIYKYVEQPPIYLFTNEKGGIRFFHEKHELFSVLYNAYFHVYLNLEV